jgi:hypothetical protein
VYAPPVSKRSTEGKERAGWWRQIPRRGWLTLTFNIYAGANHTGEVLDQQCDGGGNAGVEVDIEPDQSHSLFVAWFIVAKSCHHTHGRSPTLDHR